MSVKIDESEVGLTWVEDSPMARASHALASAGKVWIIDPFDDPEAMSMVAGLGKPVAVLQLLDRHGRDCKKVADRLGVPHVLLPDEMNDSPFQSIDVVNNRFWKEKALWCQATQTLVVAEAIGTNKLFKPSDAGAGVHLMLRMTPPRQALGTYVPRHLLVGHGRSIHGDRATKALQQAMDRSRRDLPGAILGAPGALRG